MCCEGIAHILPGPCALLLSFNVFSIKVLVWETIKAWAAKLGMRVS